MLGLNFRLTTLAVQRLKRFSPARIAGLAAWYDPSDLSTLFQDTEGTIPVTAAGQSVALVRDKSGGGHHMLQATAAARPVYQTAAGLHWLEFDGVDDRVLASIPPLSAAGAVILGALAEYKGSFGILAEVSSTDRSQSIVNCYTVASNSVTFEILGPSYTSYLKTSSPSGAPVVSTNILTSGALSCRCNAVPTGGTSTHAWPDSPLTSIAFGGRTGSNGQNGKSRVYGFVLAANELTPSKLEAVEKWMAAKTGVVL